MNRLAHESSLYLRQHANNPVDWYPWGAEALNAAKQSDRPIFLSVGYSACHWCHVMEHESFESEKIAAILNEHFICIKVDREERPDLDQIYMNAHHLLNRGEGGGWPLSVFLTPEQQPFYAGTYYPPDERYAPQRPSFPRLLHSVVNAWKTRKDELLEMGNHVAESLQVMAEGEHDDKPLSHDILDNAVQSLKRGYDPNNGGFGYAPKFPHPLEVRLLLRSDPSNHDIVRRTLTKMADGGIYDQVGGGFHRYSVDAVWLVPHFEKMLYDNALLSQAYVEAFQLTGDEYYKRTACETFDYIRKEMTSHDGGFYSTQDADSEGEEGKFYVWSEAELEEHLGSDLARLARSVFNTKPSGNFEGHNILHRVRADEQDAKLHSISINQLRSRIEEIRLKLYSVRSKRVWPGRDEKILTGWNGLMIASFAYAGGVLDRPDYVEVAANAARFVLKNLRSADGRLFRTCAEGVPAKLTGYLDDYANICDALVSLYEADFDAAWITHACELADAMIKHFVDTERGGFFYTADDHESLLIRTRDMQDGSVPSGNAMAATALLRLFHLTGRQEYYQHAEETLKAYRVTMAESPMAAGQMLNALKYYLGPVKEYVVIGKRDDEQTQRVLRNLHSQYRPLSVLAFHDPSAQTGMSVPPVALLEGKTMIDSQVTLYVCEGFACKTPLVGEAAQNA